MTPNSALLQALSGDDLLGIVDLCTVPDRSSKAGLISSVAGVNELLPQLLSGELSVDGVERVVRGIE